MSSKWKIFFCSFDKLCIEFLFHSVYLRLISFGVSSNEQSFGVGRDGKGRVRVELKDKVTKRKKNMQRIEELINKAGYK